jgi:hypothetical protein
MYLDLVPAVRQTGNLQLLGFLLMSPSFLDFRKNSLATIFSKELIKESRRLGSGLLHDRSFGE